MEISGPRETVQKARSLRQQMTTPERLLWWALRRSQAGYKFRRQHPAGPYVLDFYCDAARLCIEVDGQSHDFTTIKDQQRDAWLARQGVYTMRVGADEIVRNLDGVVQLIIQEAGNRIRG